MKDQIIDFIVKYPWALIPILLLLPFSLVRRHRRMRRRTGHVNDAKSGVQLVVGGIAALLIIVGWLWYF